MAPPQVDLSKKQPLEDVEGCANQVGDEKLPPSTVAVETSTRVAGKRALGKRRCKKLIIGMIIGAIIATAITVGAFMAHRRHHHKHWKGHVKHHGHDAEEYIRIEDPKRLIHVARNESNHFFGLLAILDYRTQLAGFKDCRKQRCYVDRLRESYEEGCARWRYYKTHSRLPNERAMRVGQAIDPDVLEYIAGEEIFSVCGRLPSFWVLEAPKDAPRDNTTEIIYL